MCVGKDGPEAANGSFTDGSLTILSSVSGHDHVDMRTTGLVQPVNLFPDWGAQPRFAEPRIQEPTQALWQG